MEFIKYLSEDAKKKKRTLSVYQSHYNRYTKYEFYGFNNDLRDKITLQKSLP